MIKSEQSLAAPEMIVRLWKEARGQDQTVTEDEVRMALAEFGSLWNELFPIEQTRIIQLLIERVEIHPDRLSIKLRKDGLLSLAHELIRKEAA